VGPPVEGGESLGHIRRDDESVVQELPVDHHERFSRFHGANGHPCSIRRRNDAVGCGDRQQRDMEASPLS
jgi:hypothetical protein